MLAVKDYVGSTEARAVPAIGKKERHGIKNCILLFLLFLVVVAVAAMVANNLLLLLSRI